MLGPLGLLSPHPGVSYLFSGADAAPMADGDGLWGIAQGGLNINGGPGMGANGPATASAGAPPVPSTHAAGPLASPPPSWTPALGEMVLKVDGKFKVRAIFPFIVPSTPPHVPYLTHIYLLTVAIQ